MTAESALTSIALHANGSTLAVGSTRGKIYLYDLRKGTEPFHSMAAHRASIQTLRFQYKQVERHLMLFNTIITNYAITNPCNNISTRAITMEVKAAKAKGYQRELPS